MTARPEHLELLRAIAAAEAHHLATPRPEPWKTWETSPYDEATLHGPEYELRAWLGRDLLEHERKRFARALADLEAAGLVVTWRRWGRRLSHVKLTEAGKAAVAELEAPCDPTTE